MKRIYRDLLILVGAFLAVWVVFILSNDYFTPKTPVASDSLQEKVAGNLRTLIFNRYDTLDNQVVTGSVDTIVERLKTGLDSTDQHFNIYILDDTTINAFATLEGDIFIFSGLIRFSDSPEMLASVIAHEMGHIVHDHYVERLSREIGINVVFTILTGGDASTIGELSKSLFSLRFSRDEEREADYFASELLLKTGISPANSTRFFLKLQREEVYQFSEALEAFTTHPDMKERIEHAANFTIPEDFEERLIELDWEAVLRQVQ
jgi:predicted Zn-dependent protease